LYPQHCFLYSEEGEKEKLVHTFEGGNKTSHEILKFGRYKCTRFSKFRFEVEQIGVSKLFLHKKRTKRGGTNVLRAKRLEQRRSKLPQRKEKIY